MTTYTEVQESSRGKTNRSHTGIEALRVLSMIMIVSLHYLGHGGLIHTPDAYNYNTGWLLESFSYVAVNCYILVSGYLLVNSKGLKLKKVASLWMQVAFYSVMIMLVFHPFDVTAFAPIKEKTYWYATAYMGLYLLHPYINKMLKTLDRKEYHRLLITLFMLLSVLSFSGADTFQVEGGYSLIWMIGLYIAGGYLRLYNVKVSRTAMFLLYVLLSLATFDLKTEFGLDVFYAYNSVTVLGASVALFMFFKEIKLDIPVVSHFFRFFGPLTFGVYLIHENPNITELLWNYMDTASYYSSATFMQHYIASVLSVFFVCAAIESVRQILFRIIKI